MAKKKQEKKTKAPRRKPTKRRTIPRPYNAGTMTEAAFWGMIRTALRRRTVSWKPILNCLANARRPYVGTNKLQKHEYQCFDCKKWYLKTKVSVHHRIPAGKLGHADDLPGFVTRLFCEIEHLEVLCHSCHDKRHETTNNNNQQY